MFLTCSGCSGYFCGHSRSPWDNVQGLLTDSLLTAPSHFSFRAFRYILRARCVANWSSDSFLFWKNGAVSKESASVCGSFRRSLWWNIFLLQIKLQRKFIIQEILAHLYLLLLGAHQSRNSDQILSLFQIKPSCFPRRFIRSTDERTRSNRRFYGSDFRQTDNDICQWPTIAFGFRRNLMNTEPFHHE